MTTAPNPLNNKIFQDATKARAWLESLLWADGRVCGYCGTVDESTPLEGRDGYYQCNSCRKQFTVQVGTVFERSHIPLNKWLMAAFLLCASKKGMSAHQMHRMLGVTYKSAWFMCHRLREAMAPLKAGPFGGEGMIIEADLTFVGGEQKNKHANKRVGRVGNKDKQIVHTLVERGGRARSDHIAKISGKTVRAVLTKQVDRRSALMTDEGGEFWRVGKEFASHESVNHSAGEYVRGGVHSNTVESYFATFQRGIVGTYHSVSEAHLKRYLAEFDFRYNERSALGVGDGERATKALKGIVGKRLTYRRTDKAGNGQAEGPRVFTVAQPI
ncbi:MAG TPA: IS1595 family transposase [Rhizomicrobium sp.]|jgi:transposase-like protein|nr:IS1595 family transposase [Rhizomicrobium sp.]